MTWSPHVFEHPSPLVLFVSSLHPRCRGYKKLSKKSLKLNPVQGWTSSFRVAFGFLCLMSNWYSARGRVRRTFRCRSCAVKGWFRLLRLKYRCTVAKINDEYPGCELCLLLHHASTANARFIYSRGGHNDILRSFHTVGFPTPNFLSHLVNWKSHALKSSAGQENNASPSKTVRDPDQEVGRTPGHA